MYYYYVIMLGQLRRPLLFLALAQPLPASRHAVMSPRMERSKLLDEAMLAQVWNQAWRTTSASGEASSLIREQTEPETVPGKVDALISKMAADGASGTQLDSLTDMSLNAVMSLNAPLLTVTRRGYSEAARAGTSTEDENEAEPPDDEDEAEPPPEDEDEAEIYDDENEAEPPPEDEDEAEPPPEDEDEAVTWEDENEAEPPPEDENEAEPSPEDENDAEPPPEDENEAGP